MHGEMSLCIKQALPTAKHLHRAHTRHPPQTSRPRATESDGKRASYIAGACLHRRHVFIGNNIYSGPRVLHSPKNQAFEITRCKTHE